MIVKGVVVAGYGVASGQSAGLPGTILLQKPYFLARGLDLRHCFNGTINVDISPLEPIAVNGDYYFCDVKWHPEVNAENFSFVECWLWFNNKRYRGHVYYPHPETKPGHVQPDSVLEIMAPLIPDLVYGSPIRLELAPGGIVFKERPNHRSRP